MKSISNTDILQFQSILHSNPILKARFKNITTKQTENIMRKFIKILFPGDLKEREELVNEIISTHKLMWISAAEYGEFTKMFLELFEDRDFLTEAAPITNKIGDSLIVSARNYELQIWRAFNLNGIILKRFSEMKPTNIKIIIQRILKLIKEYPEGVDEVKSLAKSHVHLKLSELELMELEAIFLSVKEKTREYHAKVRCVFEDFSRHLREHDGISTALFEEAGGVLPDY